MVSNVQEKSFEILISKKYLYAADKTSVWSSPKKQPQISRIFGANLCKSVKSVAGKFVVGDSKSNSKLK